MKRQEHNEKVKEVRRKRELLETVYKIRGLKTKACHSTEEPNSLKLQEDVTKLILNVVSFIRKGKESMFKPTIE